MFALLCETFFIFLTAPFYGSATPARNAAEEIHGRAMGSHSTAPTTVSYRANRPSENVLPSGAYCFGVVRRISFTFLTPALNPVPMPPRKLVGVPRAVTPRRL